jgi:hypothetical protein
LAEDCATVSAFKSTLFFEPFQVAPDRGFRDAQQLTQFGVADDFAGFQAFPDALVPLCGDEWFAHSTGLVVACMA